VNWIPAAGARASEQAELAGALDGAATSGGNYPWSSLAIFALCVWIVHGIIVYGRDERAATS
jgi:ABC-type nitrate/sulfonate/bicarbonate transport system substrate-binding protein